MSKIKVSAVSYINTIPFINGINHSNIAEKIELSTDYPAQCASKLLNNEVDLGLIPIAILPKLKHKQIISDYCIGAEGRVRTVILASKVPLNHINTIYLDYQSRTSALLVKVLAKNYWRKEFKWKETQSGFEEKVIDKSSAALVIGDKVFDIEGKYPYVYDLAEEWTKSTRLPFVFAAWTANKELPEEFVKEFNEALKIGIDNICTHNSAELNENDLHYLRKNISYDLDDKKRKGMKLFLELIETIRN